MIHKNINTQIRMFSFSYLFTISLFVKLFIKDAPRRKKMFLSFMLRKLNFEKETTHNMRF